jgi:hypothetical protein
MKNRARKNIPHPIVLEKAEIYPLTLKILQFFLKWSNLA